ncbi:MAG: hypothetical protein ABH871_01930 [Pseudomonadota bacterium]
MKKLIGVMVALAFVLVAAGLKAEETKTAAATKTATEKKAEEVCKAKNLAGDALKKCIDEEQKKLEEPTATQK